MASKKGTLTEFPSVLSSFDLLLYITNMIERYVEGKNEGKKNI